MWHKAPTKEKNKHLKAFTGQPPLQVGPLPSSSAKAVQLLPLCEANTATLAPQNTQELPHSQTTADWLAKQIC